VITEATDGTGVDCGVEAVGYQAHDKGGQEHPEMALDKLVEVVRATGRIGVVGVYNPEDPGAATEDARQGRYGFNYGLVFDKAISMGHGQCPVKRYNHQLRDLIIRGKARPSLIVSHEPQITGLLHVLADEHLRQYFYLARIRLALFLLSEHAGEDDGVLVGARLSDAAVVQDPGLDREFFLLARRHCAAVGGRDRERLLALIDRGPQSPQQQLRRERNGTPLSAAETRARVCRWQRDRLAAIEPVLPPERLAHYRDLVAEFGAAPEQPATLPAIRDIAIGSPVPVGDLAASSTEDLVKLLATWEPPGGLLGPGRPDLASALFRHPAGRGRPVIGSRGVHRPSWRVRRGRHQRLLAGGTGGHGTGLAGGPEPVLMGGPAGRGGTARPRRPLAEAVGGGPHGVAAAGASRFQRLWP